MRISRRRTAGGRLQSTGKRKEGNTGGECEQHGRLCRKDGNGKMGGGTLSRILLINLAQCKGNIDGRWHRDGKAGRLAR